MNYTLKATEALSGNLKALREAKGLTIDQLAKELGVSRQSIWAVETGKSWVGSKTLSMLADFFKVEETDLFQPFKFKVEKKLTIQN